MAIEVSSSSELGRQIQDLANQVNIELDNMLTNVRNMIVSNIDISGLEEKDPTVPGWAKQPAKPSYSTDDIIGLQATITQQNESISTLSTSVANKEDKVTGKGLSTNDYTDADKTSLASKVDKVTGKGLSTNDYTTDEKTKLAGIEAGAQVNVSADWEAAYGEAGYIDSKPDLNAMWQNIENDVSDMLADYVLTTALTTSLAGKVDKVTGKGLSTNDYTTDEKTKLAGIEAGAQVNVNAYSKSETDSLVGHLQAQIDELQTGKSEILIGIKVSTAPTKVSYKAGEALDLTGMVVQSVTSDGDNETYTDVTGWTTSPASGTTLYEDTSSILISWTSGGKTYTTTQAITVQRVLTGLSVTAPTKTSYYKGDALDLTGLVATATFSSGATEPVTGSCTFSPAEGTALTTSGTNTIAASYTENGVTKTATTTVDVAYPIYGVEWDGTSTTKLSRTDAASAFTDPVPYVAGASSYSSPFDGIQPWAGMVRSTDSSAGEVVAIPKFYYKWTKTGTKLKLQITQAAQTGFSVSPAHADRGDGTGERSVVYVGRYHSCSTYKSTTGQSPVARIKRSSARSSIHNLGTKIWQYDLAMRCTIQMLYLVEFADWNSQNVIGYGCSLSGSTQNVGLSDSMPYHTGTMQSSRTTYGAGVQYRYIEGLWENVMNWLDGAYYDSNGMNVIKNPSSFSDSSGGTSVGTPTGGWVSEFAIPSVSGYDWAIYPSAAAGDGTNYISDYWVFSTSNPCLRSGGNYDQDQNRAYGIWYMNSAGASYASGLVGCRLQLLP